MPEIVHKGDNTVCLSCSECKTVIRATMQELRLKHGSLDCPVCSGIVLDSEDNRQVTRVRMIELKASGKVY